MPRRKMTEAEKQAARDKKDVKMLSNQLKRELDDCRELRIPEPAYVHDVGDRVTYGAWDWTGIMEVLDGGKIYKCFSVTRNTGRNTPDETVCKIHYLVWYDTGLYKTEWPDRIEEKDED